MFRLLAVVIILVLTACADSDSRPDQFVDDVGVDANSDRDIGRDVSTDVEPDMSEPYVPPESCEVCVPGCDGLPAVAVDQPFEIPYPAGGDMQTLAQLTERGADWRRMFSQVEVRAPSANKSDAIWVPEGEDLIFEIGLGYDEELSTEFQATVFVNERPTTVEILDYAAANPQFQTGSADGVVVAPFEGLAARYAVRIPASVLNQGEANTLFTWFQVHQDGRRSNLIYDDRKTKWTVFAGGFDLPARPCVPDFGKSSIEPAESEFWTPYHYAFNLAIDGRIETAEEVTEGLDLEPGESVDVNLFARSVNPRTETDALVSVGAFLDGRLIAGPYTYVSHHNDNQDVPPIPMTPRPSGIEKISYRTTFTLTAPTEPGTYRLEFAGWYNPRRPEFSYEGIPLGGNGSPYPYAVGYWGTWGLSSTVLLIRVQ